MGAPCVLRDAPAAVLDLRISVAHGSSHAVMAVSGELDLATTPELEARLRERDVADGDLEMDLSQLSFIDASGLRALIAASRAAMARGHRLCVSRTSPSLDRLLRITGARGLLGLAEPVS
jgi:anti-sigma B factor antagonist